MEQLKLKGMMTKAVTFLSFIIFLCGCNKVRIENYYIPSNFIGNVAVIYGNNKSSVSKEIYNYEIPKSGILIVDRPFKEGDFAINFYQKNDLNKYDTLFEELPGKQIDTTKNRIYFNRVLTFKRDDGDVIVTTFYVGKEKKEVVDKNRVMFERSLEKIIDSSLKK